MVDQKNRNAYKRAWRNRRNYEKHAAAAHEHVKKMRRSYDNWYRALEDMEVK